MEQPLETSKTRVNGGRGALPTGHPALDEALGIGGLPKGRFLEIQSDDGAASSRVLLRAAAETQASGGIVAIIDARHDVDLALAEELGINVGELLVSQPDTPLTALEITTHLVRCGAVDLVIVDDVGALVERVPPERPAELSDALRTLWNDVSRSSCSVVFTTRPRSCIGLRYATSLRYLSSIRCLLFREGDSARVLVGKNQLASPFTSAVIPLK